MTAITPLHPLIANRWSPRSFDPRHEVDDDTLVGLLEAARWAPSSSNRQPWRFAVARRGTALHAALLDALHEGNRRWAGDAAALVVALAERRRDGRPVPTAAYDVGLAVAQMTLQAEASGLATHQMGGFDHERVRAVLAVGDDLAPLVVVAIGRRDDPQRLPVDLRAREEGTRHRRPLTQSLVLVDEQGLDLGTGEQVPAA